MTDGTESPGTPAAVEFLASDDQLQALRTRLPPRAAMRFPYRRTVHLHRKPCSGRGLARLFHSGNLPKSGNEKAVLMAEGTESPGTLEAVEFLASDDQLQALRTRLPPRAAMRFPYF